MFLFFRCGPWVNELKVHIQHSQLTLLTVTKQLIDPFTWNHSASSLLWSGIQCLPEHAWCLPSQCIVWLGGSCHNDTRENTLVTYSKWMSILFAWNSSYSGSGLVFWSHNNVSAWRMMVDIISMLILHGKENIFQTCSSTVMTVIQITNNCESVIYLVWA